MTTMPHRVRRLAGRTPLRVTLVLAILALVAVALTVAGAAANAALRRSLVARVDAQLARDAKPLSHEFTSSKHVDRKEPGLFNGPAPYFIVVSDAQGNRAEDTTEDLWGDESPPVLPTLTLDEAKRRANRPFTVAADNGQHSWRVLVAIVNDRSVALAANLADVDQTLARLRDLQLVIGLVVLVLLGAIAYVVVRRSLRPLVEVEHTAEAIASGDLSRRVPERDPRTEVGRLAQALNSMLAQIETAFEHEATSKAEARRSEERMRRFVTDASHELRTPLTSIRGFSELYRQGAVRDTDDVARLMLRIEDESARMGLLVEDLLLLARLDQQRPLERNPVDLIPVAADAVHDAQVIAPGRVIRLRIGDGPVAPVVLGDESRLRQVVANLVGNALTHTPDDAAITVRVATEPRTGNGLGAVIEVSDTGPGLSAEDAEKVFERFYRADASRTRSSGGSGLGLSIVAALTAAHGGSVEVESEPGQGATFRVVLPVLQDEASSGVPEPGVGRSDA
jgi:two-component system OmpR family sensor kinase